MLLRTILGIAAGAFVGSASAQTELPFGLGKILSPDAAKASAPSAPSPAGRESDAGLMPVKPRANVQNDLKPDLLCRRFNETSDVWQKLADYGGTEAQSRMKRLMSSDFKFSDLTPQDKAMLRYISYTSVWIPARIENSFGKMYSTTVGKSREGRALDPDEQGQLARATTQMESFKATIQDFPGDVALVLDKDLGTGAYAQVGGLVILSVDFLSRMDQKESVQRLVLAHELSHLYKRHTIKEMQYQLVTSNAGFGLAKKLLARFNPDAGSNPMAMAREAVMYATAAKELLDWTRQHQVAFGIDQELEADACSVEWMKRAGLDPKVLPAALSELEAVKSNAEGSYSHTHPTSQQRQSNLLVATGQKTPVDSAVKPGNKPAGKAKAG